MNKNTRLRCVNNGHIVQSLTRLQLAFETSILCNAHSGDHSRALRCSALTRSTTELNRSSIASWTELISNSFKIVYLNFVFFLHSLCLSCAIQLWSMCSFCLHCGHFSLNASHLKKNTATAIWFCVDIRKFFFSLLSTSFFHHLSIDVILWNCNAYTQQQSNRSSL